MVNRLSFIVIGCIMYMLFSCGKEKTNVPVPPIIKPPTDTITPPTQNGSLYSDSVLYVNNADDFAVLPVTKKAGTYSATPDGLKIEETTGSINVNKSETGLKYMVTFTPADGSASRLASLIVSGINYADGIYNLSKGDSIAAPIYNANKSLSLPGPQQNNIF